jgi:hypothetical protein
MTSATEKPKYVNQYLKQKVDEQLGGDASRFDELWERIPNLSDVLRSFSSDSNWLHWTIKTFDGWYCVENANSGFDVYYQERGHREDPVHFDEERAAIRFAINASVFNIGCP